MNGINGNGNVYPNWFILSKIDGMENFVVRG
jgi:hypothetical protein